MDSFRNTMMNLFGFSQNSYIISMELSSGEYISDLKLLEKGDKIYIDISNASDPQIQN